MLPTEFDLVVLGTGVAASSVARRASAAGLSVAIIDRQPYGGTCPLRGCDPKKVLLGAAEAIHAVRRLHGKGLQGDVHIQWPELMRFKRTFTESVPLDRERALSANGVITLHDTARFVAPTSVQVGQHSLNAGHIHIATGARPTELSIEGARHLTHSDDFLDLDVLPRRVVFIGGGYIAFELAHLAAIAGADVTMIEMRDQPLQQFDPDMVSLLVEGSVRMGIDLHLRTKVQRVEAHETGGFAVHASSDDKPVSFDADLVVHAAGRTPDLDDLDLDAAGVEHDGGGVVVNEYMQSVSNPAVYAAGDAANGGLPLTPVASLEAELVASNLLEGNHRRVDYPPIPSVVFTEPALASVGLREVEAKRRGFTFRVEHAHTSSWFSSKRLGEEFSGHKILIDKKTSQILGAHLVGPEVQELINMFALAMHGRMTHQEITRALFAYPTRASDLPHMV